MTFIKDLFLGKRDVRGTRNRAARHEFKQFDTLLTEKSNENRIRVITLNSLIPNDSRIQNVSINQTPFRSFSYFKAYLDNKNIPTTTILSRHFFSINQTLR